MSSRSWGVVFAVVGFLTQGPSFAETPGCHGGTCPTPSEQEQHDSKATTPKTDSDGFAFRVQIVQSPDEITRAEESDKQALQHDSNDLDAQVRAAAAAEESARYAFPQLMLAGAAALGLFISFYFTRQSIVLARQATDAAVNAVQVTREMGERQIRAYLGTTAMQGNGVLAGSVPEFSVRINNTGQSPAQHCRIVATLRLVEGRGDKSQIRIPVLKDMISKTNVSANSEVIINLSLGGQISEDDLSSLRSGAISFIFAGFAIYHDVFGKTRRLTFKFGSEKLKENVSTVSLRGCSKGNRSS